MTYQINQSPIFENGLIFVEHRHQLGESVWYAYDFADAHRRCLESALQEHSNDCDAWQSANTLDALKEMLSADLKSLDVYTYDVFKNYDLSSFDRNIIRAALGLGWIIETEDNHDHTTI